MAKKKKNEPISNKKERTYVAIVLDKSGSMAATKKQTISGFNEQIQQMKQNAKDQEIFCSLVTFDGEVYEHLWNVNAKDLSEASDADYKPSGSTAMRDAMGYTIQKLLNTTEHESEDNSYLVIVISDGDTNQDRHYNAPSLKEMVEACRGTGRWTFTYMGCTEAYVQKIARETAIPMSNVAAWSNADSASASAGMSNQRKRAAKYFAARAGGQKACANYMSDELGKVADFTTDQEVTDAPLVAEAVATGPTDWSNLLSKLPKYENVRLDGHVATAGDGMFSNRVGVQWERTPEPTGVDNSAMGFAASNFGPAVVNTVSRRGRV
jgi:uncharacterized protein YegL